MVGESALRNRIRVAIATLRRRGMKRVILWRKDGYLIDPAVPLTMDYFATG